MSDRLEALSDEQAVAYIKSGRAGLWHWIWTSPNGVEHLVPNTGPCATCGRHHDRPEGE